MSRSIASKFTSLVNRSALSHPYPDLLPSSRHFVAAEALGRVLLPSPAPVCRRSRGQHPVQTASATLRAADRHAPTAPPRSPAPSTALQTLPSKHLHSP